MSQDSAGRLTVQQVRLKRSRCSSSAACSLQDGGLQLRILLELGFFERKFGFSILNRLPYGV